MIPFPVPVDEKERLAALAECDDLDAPDEASFAEIARMAAVLCGTPTSAITLLDADRQWFKARVGLELTQTSRQSAFCAHALDLAAPLIVEDATTDARFSDNPLVTGDPAFRFYAGVPLRVGQGSAVGTLCVLDKVPRTLSPAQIEGLEALAAHVSQELRVRRAVRAVRASSPSSPRILGAGDVVGAGWKLDRLLGEGSVGQVFEAHRGEERAAIKFLLPSWMSNHEVVERFAREARILATLRGRHVGRILDVGNLDPDRGGIPFLVLEHLDGTDLDRVLAERGRIPWRQAASWIVDACAGLAEAHILGLVHRDLKPGNLFLETGNGGTPTLKVLDFGIAKEVWSTPLTQRGAVFGTVYYMSPEQLMGQPDIDGRSDLWALGAVLHELIAGRPPFTGANYLEVCAAVLTRPPIPLRATVPDVPRDLGAAVRRCLRAERSDRFATASELASALTAILAEEPAPPGGEVAG